MQPRPGTAVATRLRLGKIPIPLLEESVLARTGRRSRKVVTPPGPGLDFAAIRIVEGFLLVSSDAVTGVSDEIGRYAMNVSANDIATSGNRPQFAESVILLPEGTGGSELGEIAGQLHQEADKVGVSIVGGHTEVTPGLRRPIVMVTALSVAKDYISSRDARAGDTIMMSKTAGLEGTAILAADGGASHAGTLTRRFIGRMSVVDEAVASYRSGVVHAMHDCTEGGVLGAVFEMSLAAGLGFKVDRRSVPLARETGELCRKLSVDPLRLIGSGSLLLSVAPGKEKIVERALEGICKVSAIGRFSRSGRFLAEGDGETTRIAEAPEDELWRRLSRQGLR